MVKVYALSTCPWCKKVKELLDDQEATYDAVDVDLLTGDEQKQVVKEVEDLSGGRTFPVTVINEEVIVGFKKEEIIEELKK